jgi:glucose-6-phosphate 1-epimerase
MTVGAAASPEGSGAEEPKHNFTEGATGASAAGRSGAKGAQPDRDGARRQDYADGGFEGAVTMQITSLNERFAIPGRLEFLQGDHGALLARVGDPRGSADIAIQGAQVLTWAPAGQPAVVWLSPAAKFAAGKSLRGGAPVCWPWFGPHPDDPAKPAHGFARNLDWEVAAAEPVTGGTRVVLRFTPAAAQQALWPYQAELELAVTVGDRLLMELTTRNTGTIPLSITQALHTYFHVGDIAAARVEGLDGCEYVDKVDGGTRKRQSGAVTIGGEVDRVYLGCPGEVILVDDALRRRIRIDKRGSQSCVVWNPWAEKGAKFGDMGDDGYRRMLCVETTNAGDDVVTVASGKAFTLATEYSVEAL